MGLLQGLLKAYEDAEKIGLVDCQKYEETTLLPIYHSNLKSVSENIIEICVDKQARIRHVEYVPKGESIIFPVSEKSVSRSGKIPPPHPLSDKMKYISCVNQAEHVAYVEELKKWIEWQSGIVKEFLTIILNTVENEDFLKQIISFLYPQTELSIRGLELYENDPKNPGKEKRKVDLSDKFVTFKVLDFTEDKTDVCVSDYVELHNSYIAYIENSQSEGKYGYGICNISGRYGRLTNKHRGILGNTKVISISNHIEAYKGRFKKGEDAVRIGYKESEKIHLMLKYLLENKNSSVRLGESQYVLYWFSDDLKNESELDITTASYFDMAAYQNPPTRPVYSNGSIIGESFIKGKVLFDKESDFYIGIIDAASPGRVSVKYFRSMKASQLMDNLNKWQSIYNWYIKSNMEGQKKELKYTPAFYTILNAAYGVERDKRLFIDNKKFVKDQMQKMIVAMIDGRRLPENIVKAIILNINKRLKYKETWYSVSHTAMAVLNSYTDRRYNYMLDRENDNRSYLYGRLLAVFDSIEASLYMETNRTITNADKFWTAYANSPAKTMGILMEKTAIYEQKLKSGGEKKYGLYVKFNKEKKEIINLIEKTAYAEGTENEKLDYDYIFGFYAEKDYLYSKTKNEVITEK